MTLVEALIGSETTKNIDESQAAAGPKWDPLPSPRNRRRRKV